VRAPHSHRSNGIALVSIHKGDVFAANSDLGIPSSRQAVFTRDLDRSKGLTEVQRHPDGSAVLKGGAGGAGAGPGNPFDEVTWKSKKTRFIDGFAQLQALHKQQECQSSGQSRLLPSTQRRALK
jgi:hypothetical protein